MPRPLPHEKAIVSSPLTISYAAQRVPGITLGARFLFEAICAPIVRQEELKGAIPPTSKQTLGGSIGLPFVGKGDRTQVAI